MPLRKPFPDRRVLRPFAGVILGIAFAGALGARSWGAGGPESAADVQEALDEVFSARGVDRAGMIAHAPDEAAGARGPLEITVELPERATYAGLNADIVQAVETRGGRVLDVVEHGTFPDRPEAVEMVLGTPDEVTHRVTLRQERPFAGTPSRTPRIALVFDDLGYTTEGLVRELLDLGVPLTFAVLPGLPHTADFVRAARARGHEIILHLPMEPLDGEHHDPGRDALRVDLPDAENRRRLAAALDGVPDYVGISNHMGSRATADAGLMDLVLDQMRTRRRGVFFLDSKTTPLSVVPERGRLAGVRVVSNNLFLDGTDESDVVPAVQTGRLEDIARRRGRALAIGHVRPETVAAVREAVREWEAGGIRLVHVSELVGAGRPEPAGPPVIARR